MKIKYRKLRKYKYQLMYYYTIDTNIKSFKKFADGPGGFCSIFGDGRLVVCKGYCWDGASGPTIDTKSTMRASLVHDALYQLMREGIIPFSEVAKVDDLFHQILLEDGMSRFRAWYYRKAVGTWFAHLAARPDVHRYQISLSSESCSVSSSSSDFKDIEYLPSDASDTDSSSGNDEDEPYSIPNGG